MKKASPKLIQPNPRIPFLVMRALRRHASARKLSVNEAINEAVREWVRERELSQAQQEDNGDVET